MLDSVDVKRTLQFFFFFSKRSRTSPEIKFKQKNETTAHYFTDARKVEKKKGKRPGPRAKLCPWCQTTSCRHCHCKGYDGCSHAPGEPCDRERYKRRLVCNRCEKSKLNYHKKLQGLPVKCEKVPKKNKTKKKMSRNEKNDIDSISPEIVAPGDEIPPFDDVLGGIGLDGSDKTFGTTMDLNADMDPRYPSLDLEDLHDLLDDFDDADVGSLEPELILRSPHPTSTEESPIKKGKTRKRGDDYEEEIENSSIVVPGTQDDNIPRAHTMHLNVKHNKESFGVVPVNRDFDKLTYVRKYIQKRLLHELDHRKFKFLTREGAVVKREDESELIAWHNTTAKDWVHHTFGQTTRRYHLFIQVEASDESLTKRRRRAPRAGGDDDDDEDNDTKTDQDIVELFKNSSESVQEQLAWQFFSKFHGNINTRGHQMPFICAATMSQDLGIVRHLLALGANVNSRDSSGNTCLHLASRGGHLDMLRLLLRAPVCSKTVALCGFANLHALNCEGETPLDVAKDEKTRHFLKMKAFSSQTMAFSSLPDHIDGKSTLSDVRAAMIETLGIVELRFCVQGTFVRPSQENDFVFEMCDSGKDVYGKHFFSFIAVGLLTTTGSSKQKEKIAGEQKKKTEEKQSKLDITALTTAFRKKMALDKSIHQHESIASSCPAEFVRFRPPEKIRQHIAMAASASPKQHTGRMFFERLRPLDSSSRKKTDINMIKEVDEDEMKEKLSKPIPLRRTISLPSSKQSATSMIRMSPSRSTGSPSSRRVRSDHQFRRPSSSSSGFLGVFKTILCMHEKSDTL